MIKRLIGFIKGAGMEIFGYRFHRDERGIRMFARGQGEIAYAYLKLSGLQFEVEFPSDWHDYARAWVRLGLGFMKISFSFPWKTVVKDHGQCGGPRYGFHFFEDILWIRYGHNTGYSRDKRAYKAFYMPWSWKFGNPAVVYGPLPHPFTYKLEDGNIQPRLAIVTVERRIGWRWGLPFRMVWNRADIDFVQETGNGIGTWKGGTYGMSTPLRKGEGVNDLLDRIVRDKNL